MAQWMSVPSTAPKSRWVTVVIDRDARVLDLLKMLGYRVYEED